MGTEKMGIPQVEWYLTRYFTLLGQEGNVPSNWMVYVGFSIYCYDHAGCQDGFGVCVWP